MSDPNLRRQSTRTRTGNERPTEQNTATPINARRSSYPPLSTNVNETGRRISNDNIPSFNSNENGGGSTNLPQTPPRPPTTRRLSNDSITSFHSTSTMGSVRRNSNSPPQQVSPTSSNTNNSVAPGGKPRSKARRAAHKIKKRAKAIVNRNHKKQIAPSLSYAELLSSENSESEPDVDNLKFREMNDDEELLFELVATGNVSEVKTKLNSDDFEFDCNIRNMEGNTVLHIAVMRQDEDMVDTLCTMSNLKLCVIYDVLLYAVNEKNLGLVRKIDGLIATRNLISKGLFGRTKSREDKIVLDTLAVFSSTSTNFTQIHAEFYNSNYQEHITPLMLACHLGCYELIEYFMQKGARISAPHPALCKCEACKDELKRSYRRLHTYQAISNPYYICYQATKHDKYDLIYEAFKLVEELEQCIEEEPEYANGYQELINELKIFTSELLDQCRTTDEVKLVLKQKAGFHDNSYEQYPRVALAIQNEQKEFCANPNTQMALYEHWAGKEWPEWKRRSATFRLIVTLTRIPMLPLVVVITFVSQQRFSWARFLSAPVNRCLNSIASYLVFLACLFVISVWIPPSQAYRGPPKTGCELYVVLWVFGSLLSTFHLWLLAPRIFFKSLWSFYDLTTEALFIGTFIAWGFAFHEQSKIKQDTFEGESHKFAPAERIRWKPTEPLLIAEVLFAFASLLAYGRICRVVQLHYRIGPVVTSLGKMSLNILDMFMFFCIVMVSCAVGLTSIYRTYRHWTDVESKKTQTDAFMTFEKSIETLYWVLFTMSSWDSPHMIPITIHDPTNKTSVGHNHLKFTQSVGKTIFGVYHFVAVLILINLLLAIMSNTYEKLTSGETAEIEWKFKRTQLWTNFARDSVHPPPYNLIPTLPCIYQYYALGLCKKQKQIDEEAARDLDERFEYYNLVQKLIFRYHRDKAESLSVQPATGDDLQALNEDLAELREVMNLDIFEHALHDLLHTSDQESSKNSEETPKRTRQSLPTMSTSTFESPPRSTSRNATPRLAQITQHSADGTGVGGNNTENNIPEPTVPIIRTYEGNRRPFPPPFTPPTPKTQGLGRRASVESIPTPSQPSSPPPNLPPTANAQSPPGRRNSPTNPNQTITLPSPRPSDTNIQASLQRVGSAGFNPILLEPKSSVENIQLPQQNRSQPPPPPPLPPPPSPFEQTQSQTMTPTSASAASSVIGSERRQIPTKPLTLPNPTYQNESLQQEQQPGTSRAESEQRNVRFGREHRF